ncbi:MAG: malto-oligosyltrehalose trehalohydrolase [Thermodesulfobacteriota bacterium]
MFEPHTRRAGALPSPDGGTRFSVWAPGRRRVEVCVRGPLEGRRELSPLGAGYWGAHLPDVADGTLYSLLLDGELERPDPASRCQPEGVHGPSQVVGESFPWGDGGWAGRELPELVFYELHVGTFTPEGTFEAVIPRLPELRDLGVTTLELMPVAAFPGARNWGYDGVHPFAVQASYGGPEGFKRLVDACHRQGLAVFLDVVYNHLGPEGNYLADFGPYFTDRYRTPWGRALNFDGPDSDPVRAYFVQNALQWLEEYRCDGLRLDAIHAIVDTSARPFLQELAEEVEALEARLGRRLHLVAESDRNDPRFVRPRDQGGAGLGAEWCDDFHHALHALLTGERRGYYADFGEAEHLARAYGAGFVYSGQYSRYRRRRHGASSADLPGERFVAFAQNHDQVGNRMHGERLAALVPFESLKVAAAAVLLSPYLPLLFMGEEYGEDAPFLYFVSHGDPELVRAVRGGRKAEFAAFGWAQEPPDPQAEETFARSRLRWELGLEGRGLALREFHRECLRLRRELPALRGLDKAGLEAAVLEGRSALWVRRGRGEEAVLLGLNFETAPVTLTAPGGPWQLLLDSAARRWGGPGAAAPAQPPGGLTLRGPGATLWVRVPATK